MTQREMKRKSEPIVLSEDQMEKIRIGGEVRFRGLLSQSPGFSRKLPRGRVLAVEADAEQQAEDRKSAWDGNMTQREMNDRVAARLLALRKRRGLTQEVLGEQVGLSGSTIGDMERGRTQITVGRAWVLANYFGVSVGTLTV